MVNINKWSDLITVNHYSKWTGGCRNRQGGQMAPLRIFVRRKQERWRSVSARPRSALPGTGIRRPRRHRAHRRRTAAADPRQFLAVQLLGHRVAASGAHLASLAAFGRMTHRPMMPLFCRLRGCRLGGSRRRRGCARGRAGRHRGLCPGRCGDSQDGSDRNAVQEMLHAMILCVSVRGGHYAAKARLPEGGPYGSRAENNVGGCFVPANTQLSVSRIRPRQLRII